MAAWISSLSLAVLALVAGVTAFLGWRRATLFREAFPSLSIEFTQEHIWTDGSWTLLVLTAKLKNTSQVLVQIESVNWELGLMVPGTSDTLELAASLEDHPPYRNFSLEPQEEDDFVEEVWIPTPDTPKPAFAQLMVHCSRDKSGYLRGWTRRIHFILEGSYG